mmetsp:Transcript_23542/g.66202  ORF Transcript_23542/g.66202 Transcript_23542/m.66202 type:complete len:117 (-) Transcript_23542:39-389(-)
MPIAASYPPTSVAIKPCGIAMPCHAMPCHAMPCNAALGARMAPQPHLPPLGWLSEGGAHAAHQRRRAAHQGRYSKPGQRSAAQRRAEQRRVARGIGAAAPYAVSGVDSVGAPATEV